MSLTEEIEARRRAGIQVLKAHEMTLSQKSFTNLTRLNNMIAEDLLYAINLGRELMQDPEITDLDWTLKQLIDCMGPPSLEKMARLIMSKLGANNSKIRGLAVNLASAISSAKELELSDVAIIQKTLYPYQGKIDINELEQKFQGLKKLISVGAEIAERIYCFAASLKSVPERREYYQPPIATLEHVGGGDCDDLAMLLCSLWESIGFETTLNTVPEHVIPGVKLLVPYKTNEGCLLRICNIKADPFTLREGFNMFKFSLGLCNGEKSIEDFKHLKKRWRLYYKEEESHTVPPVNFPFYLDPFEALGEMKDEW